MNQPAAAPCFLARRLSGQSPYFSSWAGTTKKKVPPGLKSGEQRGGKRQRSGLLLPGGPLSTAVVAAVHRADPTRRGVKLQLSRKGRNANIIRGSRGNEGVALWGFLCEAKFGFHFVCALLLGRWIWNFWDGSRGTWAVNFFGVAFIGVGNGFGFWWRWIRYFRMSRVHGWP